MIIILAILCAIVYYWLTKNYNYWRDQNVPYVKPILFFGNIKDLVLMKKTTGETYKDIYKNFYGLPAGGFFKFREPMLVLRDPELIRTVMVKEFIKFQHNDFQVSKEVDPLLAINPFAIQGPEWKNIRAIQLPAQTLSKVKTMVPDMINCCQNMTEYINKNMKNSHEGKKMAGFYTGDTVAACAFGLKSNSFTNDGNAFAAVTSGEVFGSSYWDNFSILCAMLAPKLGSLLKLRVIHKEVEDYFVKVINAASTYRIEHGIKRNDFLQQLIDTNTESITGQVYTNLEMAGHCMTFYMDGYETTSILLCFALFELAGNQEIQDRLREEILSVSSNINDFDTSKIQSLTYLDNVLSECLRLHPPIQSVTRVCTESTTLKASGKCYNIKKGMSVVIPIYALHTDPEYFPEPYLFNPDRFSKENRASIKKFTYIPYGEGPRICIGVRFALTQVKLAIISIMLQFKIYQRDKLKGPVKLDPMSTFLHTARDGLWLKYEKL